MASLADYESPVLSPSSILSATLSSPYLSSLVDSADTWDDDISSVATSHSNSNYNNTYLYHPRHQSIPRSHSGVLTSTHTGRVRKKHSSRHRSASALYAERLRHSSLDRSSCTSIADSAYSTNSHDSITIAGASEQASLGPAWQHTPQHSPQPSVLFPDPDVSLEPPAAVTAAVACAAWRVPTPPGSDSGYPTYSVRAAHEQASGACGTDLAFDDVVASVEMGSLGYLLPGQYSNGISEPDLSDFDMEAHRTQSVTGAPSPWSQGASSSPALYQGRIAPQYTDNRQLSSTPGSLYGGATRGITGPYDSPPTTSAYSLPPSNTIPPLSGLPSSLPMSNIGSPAMATLPPQYGSNVPRHPGGYDPNYYGQPQSYTAAAAAPPPPPVQQSMYSSQQNSTYTPGPYNSDQVSRASSSDLSSKSPSQRSKAQCWEHGCNGRQFSTFSNLLRHQREKSGTASKSYCPRCGAEFTRTTARNGHLLHDKCTKARRTSEER